MPDLSFVRAPHWGWLAVGYFFLGGIAGGCYLLAAIADLFGRGKHARVVRLGYLVSAPAVVLGSILLVVDLERPERFWHMLVQSERGLVPMFKWWSPISIGAWALAVFGFASALSAAGTLSAEGKILPRALSALRRGLLGRAVSLVGLATGFFVAAYTGVLLSVTNRPVWSETTLLGLVFLLSAASSSSALLLLLLKRRPGPEDAASRRWLSTLESRVLLLEVLSLVALVVTLGASARVWWNAWGLFLAFGVVGLGMVVPLALRSRRAAWAPALVLVGGFLLRVAVVIPVERL